MTLEDLRQIMPHAGFRAEIYLDPLNAAMDEFDINTPLRKAAFLAQLAHESGSLRYVREIATGGAYEGRKDLGNTEPGDGIKYKGRGFIQVTGRFNYQACGDYLGLDLLAHPELLEEPINACRSAGWFWSQKRLNELADAEKFETITRKVNGGLNGYQDRLEYYARARRVFGA